MSNRTLIKRMESAIEEFKADQINIEQLKDSIELNGNALEMMPYSMVKDLSEIEYKLTVSQFADEEECYPDIEETLKFIESWIEKLPTEQTG